MTFLASQVGTGLSGFTLCGGSFLPTAGILISQGFFETVFRGVLLFWPWRWRNVSSLKAWEFWTLSIAKEEAIKPIRRALSSTQRAASCFSKLLSDPPVNCSGEPGLLVTFKRPWHVHHPSSRRRTHFGNHDLTGSHSPQFSSVTSVLTLLRTQPYLGPSNLLLSK